MNFIKIFVYFLIIDIILSIIFGRKLLRKEFAAIDKKKCLIPTCNRKKHKYGICRKHYNFYVQDDESESLIEYLFRLYNNSLTFREKLILTFKGVLHAFTYLSFKGYEHFPLENIFDLFYKKAIKFLREDKPNDALRILSQLKIDFEDPQNYLRFEVEKKINDSKIRLSNVESHDLVCEKYLKRLSEYSVKTVFFTSLIAIVILSILYFLSYKSSVSGIIGPKIFFKVRIPLLFIYGLLISIYFGILAVKRLPKIYHKLIKHEFYSNKKEHYKNYKIFLEICSSLKKSEHQIPSHRGILSAYFLFSIGYIIYSVSKTDFVNIIYRLLEMFFVGIVFYILTKLLFFIRTIDYAVDLESRNLKIEISHQDCVGGLMPYTDFLFYSFIMGLSISLWFTIIPPILLYNNIISHFFEYFLLIGFLSILISHFIHCWHKSFMALKAIRAQMIKTKNKAVKKIEFLKSKRNINVKESRELVVLIDAIHKFKTFPIVVNSIFISVLKILIGYIITTYLLPELMNFVKDVSSSLIHFLF